jgi:hypothetical protein
MLHPEHSFVYVVTSMHYEVHIFDKKTMTGVSCGACGARWVPP